MSTPPLIDLSIRPAGLSFPNKPFKSSLKNVTKSPVLNSGLERYEGQWSFETAKHLLKRATYGPNKETIDQGLALGMDGLVEMLLTDLDAPEPPINYNYDQDPFVPIGNTWVDQPDLENTNNYRERSLRAWLTGLMINEGISAREKMTLFWHNHLVTADVPVAKFNYQYLALLRSYAFGNFRTLIEEITINPSMLFYLNGNQNSQQAPNENYARELCELFTVGKGEPVGPGDYTTFTEDDVREISKILTGWRINYNPLDNGLPKNFFNIFRHDLSVKQLSNRFDNASVANEGENEYKTLIGIIFQNPYTAKYICKKIYQWFVYYQVDETIEANVIEPMAKILEDNDFEVKPVLEALFKSQHFYDINSVGCMIKSPIDFIVGSIKEFYLKMPDNFTQEYGLWLALYNVIAFLQQQPLLHPSVAGWKAYYQEPAFYRIWINSVTLPPRMNYAAIIGSIGYNVFDERFGVDTLQLVEGLENPTDPNALIREIADIAFVNGISDDQLVYLKEFLIPGLPDFEWTVEYQDYLNNPEDEAKKTAIQNRLRSLMAGMLTMPEYQLQ
ncbi:MAG: DUF1800 domain-containing protein [Saprospiraceae bacterium]|nr:DUF1800 domain-containing protein [Saprospiraceae bacterium]